MKRDPHQQVFSTGDWWEFECEDGTCNYRRVYMADETYFAPPADMEAETQRRRDEFAADVEAVRRLRRFDTGATRDTEDGKLDYEGFLSPLVLKRFAEFMHKHRVQSDGGLRDSDNWQKGIPLGAYMKSGWRHFMDWWLEHRRGTTIGCDVTEEALCALLFNVQGYLHEILQERGER